MQAGSAYYQRARIPDFITPRDELLGRAGDLFGWVRDGGLKVSIDSEFDLAQADQAHRRLQGRESAGKIILRI